MLARNERKTFASSRPEAEAGVTGAASPRMLPQRLEASDRGARNSNDLSRNGLATNSMMKQFNLKSGGKAIKFGPQGTEEMVQNVPSLYLPDG